MKFTYYGHSCFAIELKGKHFLFDPFISGNPLAKEIDINSIEADYILVSHGHEDHTADLVSIAKRTGAIVISNFEIIAWAKKQGITHTHAMNFGSFEFDFGKLTLFQAQHSSSFADGTYAGAAGGFILASDAGNFYYSGDTSLMLDMQLVPLYTPVDFAILPVGGNFTMTAAGALKASHYIKCNYIIGVHFDTFDPIKIDHEKAKLLFSNEGKRLLLPDIGKTYDVISPS